MDTDWRTNRFSYVGIVCGICGLGIVPVATIAFALGWWGRKRGEQLWWCAFVAGGIGLVVGSLITAAFNTLTTLTS